MKILVVYYSLTGNVATMAQAIATAVGADLLSIQPKNDLNKNSLMRYLWGGRQVLMKERPELEDFDKNPSDYDLLFIGTPVWAWSYCPAINSFLSLTDLTGKDIALFACHAGGKGKVFDMLSERLIENVIVAKHDWLEPLKHNESLAITEAGDWAKEVVNKLKL